MRKREFEKDPLELILSGQKIKEVVKTRRGEFEITYPLPSDLRKVDFAVASIIGDRNIASFTKDAIFNIRLYCTLDVVITKAPSWWDKLESADQCADDDLCLRLYEKYVKFYNEIQRVLSEGTYGKDVGSAKLRSENKAVDSGAFSGITD